eukprot:gene11790-biopygen4727
MTVSTGCTATHSAAAEGGDLLPSRVQLPVDPAEEGALKAVQLLKLDAAHPRVVPTPPRPPKQCTHPKCHPSKREPPTQGDPDELQRTARQQGAEDPDTRKGIAGESKVAANGTWEQSFGVFPAPTPLRQTQPRHPLRPSIDGVLWRCARGGARSLRLPAGEGEWGGAHALVQYESSCAFAATTKAAMRTRWTLWLVRHTPELTRSRRMYSPISANTSGNAPAPLPVWHVCRCGKFAAVAPLPPWHVCPSGTFAPLARWPFWHVCPMHRPFGKRLASISTSIPIQNTSIPTLLRSGDTGPCALPAQLTLPAMV